MTLRRIRQQLNEINALIVNAARMRRQMRPRVEVYVTGVELSW